MKGTFNQNAAVRSAIRRVFSRSPIVREIMWKVRREVPKYNKDGSRAKKDAVQYQCKPCQTWTKSTAISVDHIVPVISVEEGFKDWNTFVERLFCNPSNLQVICDNCHQSKTNEERSGRQLLKDKAELDELAEHICDLEAVGNLPPTMKKSLKKMVSKFATKKKPQEIKDRANSLKKRIDEI